MKGYSYPGESPLKGARKRRQEKIAENRMAAEELMEGAFEDTGIDEATDLMKSEGFTINAKSNPAPDTLSKSGPPKRSPA